MEDNSLTYYAVQDDEYNNFKHIFEINNLSIQGNITLKLMPGDFKVMAWCHKSNKRTRVDRDVQCQMASPGQNE